MHYWVGRGAGGGGCVPLSPMPFGRKCIPGGSTREGILGFWNAPSSMPFGRKCITGGMREHCGDSPAVRASLQCLSAVSALPGFPKGRLGSRWTGARLQCLSAVSALPGGNPFGVIQKTVRWSPMPFGRKCITGTAQAGRAQDRADRVSNAFRP